MTLSPPERDGGMEGNERDTVLSRKKIISRLIQIVIVLVGISFLTFLLTYLAPGEKRVYDLEIEFTDDVELIESYKKRASNP